MAHSRRSSWLPVLLIRSCFWETKQRLPKKLAWGCWGGRCCSHVCPASYLRFPKQESTSFPSMMWPISMKHPCCLVRKEKPPAVSYLPPTTLAPITSRNGSKEKHPASFFQCPVLAAKDFQKAQEPKPSSFALRCSWVSTLQQALLWIPLAVLKARKKTNAFRWNETETAGQVNNLGPPWSIQKVSLLEASMPTIHATTISLQRFRSFWSLSFFAFVPLVSLFVPILLAIPTTIGTSKPKIAPSTREDPRRPVLWRLVLSSKTGVVAGFFLRAASCGAFPQECFSSCGHGSKNANPWGPQVLVYVSFYQ